MMALQAYCYLQVTVVTLVTTTLGQKIAQDAPTLIIDNSEYLRNGVYHLTSFETQADAVITSNIVFQTKIDSDAIPVRKVVPCGQIIEGDQLLLPTTVKCCWNIRQ